MDLVNTPTLLGREGTWDGRFFKKIPEKQKKTWFASSKTESSSASRRVLSMGSCARNVYQINNYETLTCPGPLRRVRWDEPCRCVWHHDDPSGKIDDWSGALLYLIWTKDKFINSLVNQPVERVVLKYCSPSRSICCSRLSAPWLATSTPQGSKMQPRLLFEHYFRK